MIGLATALAFAVAAAPEVYADEPIAIVTIDSLVEHSYSSLDGAVNQQIKNNEGIRNVNLIPSDSFQGIFSLYGSQDTYFS